MQANMFLLGNGFREMIAVLHVMIETVRAACDS
jgi:hypothetical protein